jgi:pimeloyl-ACP methyl ester carboxylesterase
MLLIYLLIIIVLLPIFLFVAIARGFRNKKIPHSETPGDYDIPFDIVWIPTKNNKELHAWRIPAQTECTDISPTLILVHGWNRNLARMMPYIKELQPRGYNLLVFDSRGHGSSERDKFSSMLHFAEDIESALKFILHEPCVDHEKIGVIGLSIGGAASIYAASKNPKIRSVVTVGAFAHPVDIMQSEIEKKKLPFLPLGSLFFKYVEFRLGTTFQKLAPENNIGKSDAKILLIHGKADETADFSHAERLYAASQKDNVELWALADKGHSDCYKEEGYWDKIDEFMRQAFR